MTPVLILRNLGYHLQDPALLRGLNLTLNAGELLIICGQSGIGKSTLLRIIIGLDPFTSGDINIFSKNLRDLSSREFNKLKAKTGFVFQNSALLSNKTVEENLRLPLIYHNLADEKEIENRVEKALEMLLIKEYRNRYPAQLSIGLQKRTAMARAVITRPDLILMDEPTSGLDAISRSLLLALIQNIRQVQGSAMIMVTNDLVAMKYMSAPIGVLKDGELLEPMGYDQLKKTPDAFVQSLMQEMGEAA